MWKRMEATVNASKMEFWSALTSMDKFRNEEINMNQLCILH